MILEEIFL